jgi:hypothetical protein
MEPGMSGLIPLLKLIIDSGAVSPIAPTDVTPPSSKAGIRPNCGLGKKAILVNDVWQCVPDFK